MAGFIYQSAAHVTAVILAPGPTTQTTTHRGHIMREREVLKFNSKNLTSPVEHN